MEIEKSRPKLRLKKIKSPSTELCLNFSIKYLTKAEKEDWLQQFVKIQKLNTNSSLKEWNSVWRFSD